MYSPLSPSYIPEIYPSNLSIVTPSPDSYFRFLSTQQSLLQSSQEPHKNESDNVTVHEVSNGLNGMLYPTVPTRGVGYGYDDTIKDCPFIDDENHVRGLKAGAYWLYTGSILLLLACNIIFLIWIMKVVISQLKTETSELLVQHMKAAKALLVIIPLLGLTQVITIYGPKLNKPDETIDQKHSVEESNYSSIIYLYARALLLSTQGLVITLPYCFLHTEVRGILRQNLERWKMTRSIGRRSIPTIRMEGIDGDSLNIGRFRSGSINGQIANRIIPEATEMSVLISPTKSKSSGISDGNSQNNGISNENTNSKTTGLFLSNKQNGTDEECKPMLLSNSQHHLRENNGSNGPNNRDHEIG